MPACERSLTTTSLCQAAWPGKPGRRLAAVADGHVQIFVTEEFQIELPEIGAVV